MEIIKKISDLRINKKIYGLIKTGDRIKMMKIKCTKCGIEEDISEEDIKLLAHVVKKYKAEPNPADYLGVLSIIKGDCNDNGKHIFIFDESFEQEVVNTIKEYQDAISKNVEWHTALEKISNQIIGINNMLEDLEKNKEQVLAEMSAGGILIDNVKLKLLKLTGCEDTEMWSKYRM